MEKFHQGCSLDCYDLCKLDIFKEDGKIVKIVGNKENKFTSGIMCIKGKKHLDRLYDKDRIKKPLLNKDGKFIEIEFEEAISIICDKLKEYKNKYSSTSVLNYCESGSGGLLKGIEEIFFNFYGGVVTSEGSTCWGAGNKAQSYDFGNRKCSDIDDIFNSETIILWGRNPAHTSVHLYERVLRAKKKNIKIITIDPRKNETSKISDLHIQINPATDGAFAMAITKYLVDYELYNKDFTDKYILGFNEYKNYLKDYSLEFFLKECGVSNEEFEKFMEYFLDKKVSAFLGYGMQKYSNGGNTIRAIDALMGISGNIGTSGCGIFYSNRIYPDLLNRDPYESSRKVESNKTFYVADFVNFINSNEVKAIFISKANPLNQFPNLNETIAAFEKVEFKVCLDLFITDTAKYCDLIIPVTNTLETEDIIYSSMHMPYLMYNEKVVEPDNILMDEYYFYQELAKKMGMKDYPYVKKDIYLNKVLEPLEITIEDLKKKEINLQKEIVAWEDKQFETPSGKIEIYSERAKSDGLSAHPIYISPKSGLKEYTTRLLTPHPKNSLFSQHFRDIEGISKIYVSKKNMNNFIEGEKVQVVSKYGKIESEIYLDDTLKENTAYIFIGWHHRHGNPNFLTENGSSEMGGQINYCDTFIKILKK